MVHLHAFAVEPTDIDELGHASNLAYLRWTVDAALDHSRAVGWSPEMYRARGVAWVVREHHIEYFKPALVGDRLVTRTWVASMMRITSIRRYEIMRPVDGALLAQAWTNWAFIDLATGRPQRVLPEILRAYPVVLETTPAAMLAT